MLVVGDIGGQFDALMKLTEKWAWPICLVGDPNDRGPKSREIIEWCMANEKDVLLLDSNHADLLCDFYHGIVRYGRKDFLRNGGYQTLVSYGMPVPSTNYENPKFFVSWARRLIPKAHIEFLETRPMFLETADAIISHAPVPAEWMLLKPDLSREEKTAWYWNRNFPIKLRVPKWQIFGHNAHYNRDTGFPGGLVVNKKAQWICLDDSAKDRLTGMVWPEQNFVQVPFQVNLHEPKEFDVPPS